MSTRYVSPTNTGVPPRESGTRLAKHLLASHECHGCTIQPSTVLAPNRPIRPHTAQKRPEVPAPHSPISGINTAARPHIPWFLISFCSPAHHSKPGEVVFPEDLTYTSISNQCLQQAPRFVLPQSPPQLPAKHHPMSMIPANETTKGVLGSYEAVGGRTPNEGRINCDVDCIAD